MRSEELIIRPLSRPELDTAIEWAAAEGWNPGLHDAEVFWNTDPEGFFGADLDGKLVATGSVVSYGMHFGFMGLFIVRNDQRGRGIGKKLWFHRRDFLRSRLKEEAAIGMDGVFDMQDWYARGGFAFSHRNLRMQGIGKPGRKVDGIVTLSDVPFDALSRYDRHCFGCNRDRFLKYWTAMEDAAGFAFVSDDRLCGYGVIRRCLNGHKIGPLFADDERVAEALFVALSDCASGEPISLDIPEINSNAATLAERYGMSEVFGCARMYHGSPPSIPWNCIYGITTFELG